MRPLKLVLTLACATSLFLGFALAADKAPLDAKGRKLTCCEKAFEQRKECGNKCCVAAHRDGKSCLKCNPEKQDLKWKEANKKVASKAKAAK